MRFTGAALVLLASLGGCVSSQRVGDAVRRVNRVTPPQAPSYQFLERIYAGASTVDTTMMYEAQVPTHVFLVDRLPNAYDLLSSDAGVGTARAWRFIITPMFRVRQLNDSSAAVRTPSFMPRVSLDHLWVSRLGAVRGEPDAPEFAGVSLAGFRTTIAHHSNGQAGCFREGFVPRDSRANVCILDPAPGADTMTVRLNRANGDFSSTFVNLLAHATFANRDEGSEMATHSAGIAAGYDWHVQGIFGELSDEQRELYGSWRARLHLEGMQRFGTQCLNRQSYPGKSRWEKFGCIFRGRLRIEAEREWAPTDLPGTLADRIEPPVLPWRQRLWLSYTFDALLRTGLFVRGHNGQDYYNIGFVHRRKDWLLGLTLDLSGDDRIGKRIVQ